MSCGPYVAPEEEDAENFGDALLLVAVGEILDWNGSAVLPPPPPLPPVITFFFPLWGVPVPAALESQSLDPPVDPREGETVRGASTPSARGIQLAQG